MPDPSIAPAVLAEDLRADPDDRLDIYVRLSDGPVVRCRETVDGVTVDFDAAHRAVGVEILDALQVTINGVPAAAPGADTATADDLLRSALTAIAAEMEKDAAMMAPSESVRVGGNAETDRAFNAGVAAASGKAARRVRAALASRTPQPAANLNDEENER